jgi:hypothetical protein
MQNVHHWSPAIYDGSARNVETVFHLLKVENRKNERTGVQKGLENNCRILAILTLLSSMV